MLDTKEKMADILELFSVEWRRCRGLVIEINPQSIIGKPFVDELFKVSLLLEWLLSRRIL